MPLTVETAAEATPEPPFQLGKRVNSLARDRLSRCCSSSARIARTGGAGPTRFPGRRVPLGVVRKASEVVTEPSGAGIVVPALPVSRSETPCLAASTPMTARPCRARPVQPPTPGLPAAIPAHRRRSRLPAAGPHRSQHGLPARRSDPSAPRWTLPSSPERGRKGDLGTVQRLHSLSRLVAADAPSRHQPSRRDPVKLAMSTSNTRSARTSSRPPSVAMIDPSDMP